MTTFVLAPYPVSGGFREKLDELAGEAVSSVVLPELRRLGFAALIRRLRSLHGHCIIALEDPSSEPLLPILEALTLLTHARSVDVVRRDLSAERTSRIYRLTGLTGLAFAAVDGQRSIRAARREVAELQRTPRATPRLEGRSVLYINAQLWLGVRTGGAAAHTTGVVRALAAKGWDVTLATASEPLDSAKNARVRRLAPPRPFGLPVETNLYRFGRSIPSQLADLPAPSFVYQRHAVASYAGVLTARRAGVPLVLEYNGSEIWVARHWTRPLRYESLARAAEEASLRHANLIVAVSEVLRDELIGRGVERERIVCHPNGVDVDRLTPDRFTPDQRAALRRRFRIANDAVVVTFVGTFGQWHGAGVLSRMIRAQAKWARDADVRFLLVGDGLEMAVVQAELSGLEDIATLTGLVPQEEVAAYLASSDVLVAPHVPNPDGTRFFGSPTKLFEYMASGKAIVASDLDQIGDVLRDDLAILVRPGDVDDLARGVREAVADPARRRRLGDRARRHVLEHFTWNHQVDAILAALDRVSS